MRTVEHFAFFVIFTPLGDFLNISSSDADKVLKQDLDKIVQELVQIKSLTGELNEHLTELRENNDLQQKNITALELDNDVLHNQLTALQIDFNVLQSAKIQQDNIISNLTEKLKEIHNKTMSTPLSSQDLSSDVSAIRNDLSDIISAVSSNRQQTSAIRDDLVFMHREHILLEKTIEEQYRNISVEIQQLTDSREPIGFTAKNSGDISNVADNQIVIFETPISNFHNSYDHTTGIFTAFRSGVYLFYADLRTGWDTQTSWKSKICWLSLVRNGAQVTTIFLMSVNESSSSDSTLAIIHLDAGDKVWIRKKHYRGVCTLDNNMTFSGYLLK